MFRETCPPCDLDSFRQGSARKRPRYQPPPQRDLLLGLAPRAVEYVRKYMQLPKSDPAFQSEINRLNTCSDDDWLAQLRLMKNAGPGITLNCPLFYAKNRFLNHSFKTPRNSGARDDPVAAPPLSLETVMLGLGIQGCIQDDGSIKYANAFQSTSSEKSKYYTNPTLAKALTSCPAPKE